MDGRRPGDGANLLMAANSLPNPRVERRRINKMSDYCEAVLTRKSSKPKQMPVGSNALYWDFHCGIKIAQRRIPRLGIVYQQLQKMPEAQKQALQQRAIWLKQHMNGVSGL